ncbi:hypothetical protein Tco_0659891 [Tanacetum coccineum]
MQMVGGNGRNQFRQYVTQNVGNQNGYNAVQNVKNQNRNGNVVVAQAEGNGNRNNGIQLQAKEFDLMATTRDLDDIEKVNANCISMANLQQASTLGTQTDKAPVYDSDGLVENDSNVISAVSNVEQSRGTVEKLPATVKETCAYFESLYNNLAIEVEKVNSVNRKMKQTNADLTTKLARYKNQEKRFDINQEKYDKLERSLAKKANESLAKHKALEFEIECLLIAVVSQDIMSIVQNPTVVETSDLQTELEQCKYDKISYDKAYNDMQQKIEWLQAQLGDLKGKCKDTPCVSDTLDSLSQKIENENIELEINPTMNSKEDKFVPINKVRASVRTNLITTSQPHVITKKDVNSELNG